MAGVAAPVWRGHARHMLLARTLCSLPLSIIGNTLSISTASISEITKRSDQRPWVKTRLKRRGSVAYVNHGRAVA